MNRGFSLVEISIVLVILGLLTGGILGGKALISASELRAIGTEFSRYQTAVVNFNENYNGLPGDIANAQSYWGIADVTPATCVSTAGSGTQTCNGNADGMVVPSTGSQESFRFWQHLANAGLLEGNYDGITHGASIVSSTAANSPVSKFSQGLWWTWYYGNLTSTTYFDGFYGNFLLMGGAVADNAPTGFILTPEQLWNLDTKLDDGKPAQGNLVAFTNGVFSNCTDGATSASLTANYLLTSGTKTCIPIFRNVF